MPFKRNNISTPLVIKNTMTDQLQARFQEALQYHQRGDLVAAQSLYQEILQAQPNHFDSLHLLGIIAFQTKNFPTAVELIGKAIEIFPNNPAFYSNRGAALQELKQPAEAIQSYDRAIALQPDYADAYYNRGVALQELKLPVEAIESYDRAIALKPDYAEAYCNRGLALQELKQPAEAIESYDRTIALKPDYADAYYNRGNALKELKQPVEAIESYDRAIALKPDYAEAYCNRGVALQELKLPVEAIESYDRAIALKPDYAEAYYNRGVALQELKLPVEAIESYDRAIVAMPDYAEAYSNRGVVLQELKQLPEAIESYDRAITLKPDYAVAYSNRGVALQELEQLSNAIESYDRAIALKPDYAEAHFNKSIALLMDGDFAQGLELYEWRWKKDDFTSPERNFQQPLWLGDNTLTGKTILLHSEQGLGDTIQFCRYTKLVAELGARVILEVEKPLVPLLQEFAGVSELVVKGDSLPPFDYHCPLLSLPLAFKTELHSIPYSNKYLRSNQSKHSYWASKLGSQNKLRVGIVWSGSSVHKNDKNRSIQLADMMQQLPLDCQYVSLQKEVRDIDKSMLHSTSSVLHYGEELHDFADTAALCELMDIIISVDTSVAHLCGAMGKVTWVLLSFSPDWRWLLDRDDSPWYRSIKLYRQHNIGDWDSVLENVANDLNKCKKQNII